MGTIYLERDECDEHDGSDEGTCVTQTTDGARKVFCSVAC